jgi:hypothetical protein
MKTALEISIRLFFKQYQLVGASALLTKDNTEKIYGNRICDRNGFKALTTKRI